MSTAPAHHLTAIEKHDYDECKAIIRTKLNSFMEVGQALMRVRDGRLYRAEYKTFQAFISTEYSMSRSNGYRLIEAAKIAKNVSPDGTECEKTLRPLSGFTPELQRIVYSQAKEESGRKLNDQKIQEVLERIAATAYDSLPEADKLRISASREIREKNRGEAIATVHQIETSIRKARGYAERCKKLCAALSRHTGKRAFQAIMRHQRAVLVIFSRLPK